MMKLQEIIKHYERQKEFNQQMLSSADTPNSVKDTFFQLDEIYTNTIAALNDLQKAVNDIYRACPCHICKHFKDKKYSNVCDECEHHVVWHPYFSWQHTKGEANEQSGG